MQISDRSHLKNLALLIVALAALAAALSACGGGGASEPNASAGGGQSASTGGSTPQFRWELKFTHCLREQGISIGDPDPGTGAPAVEHDAAYLAASKTCEGQIGEPPAATASSGPEAEKERAEAELKTAKCLREHGVDAADPTPAEALVVPEGTSSKVLDECTSGAGK